MSDHAFTIEADGEPLLSVLEELISLNPPPEIIEAFVKLKQCRSNLFKTENVAATGTGNSRLVFKPALPLLELVAAARAVKVQ